MPRKLLPMAPFNPEAMGSWLRAAAAGAEAKQAAIAMLPRHAHEIADYLATTATTEAVAWLRAAARVAEDRGLCVVISAACAFELADALTTTATKEHAA